jgi:serine/threonine protein kinase
MAPEQFRGIVSRESDQYSLGCIAYELFTGQRPFGASDFIAMGFKHTTENPPPPSEVNPLLPGQIGQVILKAMAKERSARYSEYRCLHYSVKGGCKLSKHPGRRYLPHVATRCTRRSYAECSNIQTAINGQRKPADTFSWNSNHPSRNAAE